MRVAHTAIAQNYVVLQPFLAGVDYDQVTMHPKSCTSCGLTSYIKIGYVLIIKNDVQAIQVITSSHNSILPLKSSKLFNPNGKQKCAIAIQFFNQLDTVALPLVLKYTGPTSSSLNQVIYSITKVGTIATINMICVAKCLTNNSYVAGPVSAKTCLICPVLPNCISCQSATKCWICISRYYRRPTIGDCLFCAANFQNCVECISSKCFKCMVGYTVYLQGGFTQCTKCSSLVLNCLTCQVMNSTICYQCVVGYYPVKYCPYSLNCTYICLPCRDECLTCSNNYTCIKCKFGYLAELGYAHSPACTKVNDTLSFKNARCIECAYPNKLDSIGGCSLCYEGYSLANSYCSNIAGCMVAIDLNSEIECITCKFNENFHINPVN